MASIDNQMSRLDLLCLAVSLVGLCRQPHLQFPLPALLNSLASHQRVIHTSMLAAKSVDQTLLLSLERDKITLRRCWRGLLGGVGTILFWLGSLVITAVME